MTNIVYNSGEKDTPAIEYNDGTKKWYKEGLLHREGDKPAIECGIYKIWYKEGKIHRKGDMPAVEYKSGWKMWYKEGKLREERVIARPTKISRRVLL